MELYNELIRETEGLLEGKPFRRWDYEAGMSCRIQGRVSWC